MNEDQYKEYLTLIRELCDLHDFVSASTFIDEFKKDYPYCLDVYIEEVNLWFSIGDPSIAQNSIDMISKLAPGSAADFFAQGIAIDHAESQKAIELLDRAINLNPNFERAWFVRGCLHLKQENYLLAEQDLDQAIAMNPRHERAILYSAEAKSKIKNWTGAIWNLSDYLRLPEIYEEEYACRLMAFCCNNLASDLKEKHNKGFTDITLEDLF